MDQGKIDRLRNEPIKEPMMIIGGKTALAMSGRTLPVISPIDGQEIAQIPDADKDDVDMAVSAARLSFESSIWAGLAPAARKSVLLRWADLIEENALELAVLGVRDNGTEISMAYKAEPISAIGTIRYYAEAIDKVYGEVAPTGPDTLGMILREPVGVVAAIVPWNFPMMIAAWKIAPALASGNSVVVKPSEMASLTVMRMVALALEAGLPDGVLNVVTGTGAVAGKALARSMDVDALAFTGSGRVGRQLMEYAAQTNLKRVFLELGGKSPQIIFDDCMDLDKAATAVVNGIFRNAGQVCVAGSRLIVQRSIYDVFLKKIIELTAKMCVGDPLNITTQIGALNSESHMQRVLDMVTGAHSTETGGERVHTDTGGFYIAPTIISGVTEDDPLFKEEVFGPILTVTVFDEETDATRLANDTELGLAAGIWTDNLSRAHRMAAAVRAGVVHVNTFGGVDNTVPLGGYKQSGNGQDKSLLAIDKFTNRKTVWIKL